MTAFYSLMTSLPRLPSDFRMRQVLISKMQLMKRINLLPNHEKDMAIQFIEMTWDDWFAIEKSNKNITLMMKLDELACNNIKSIIEWMYDIRSILSAIRLRRDDPSVPENVREILITHWQQRIINHWSETDFSLGNIYPWINIVVKHQADHQPQLVEEIVISQLWRYLQSIETMHYFDLEALFIYLLRWQIINYWYQFDSDKALTSMNDRISAILINHQIEQQISDFATEKDGLYESK